MLLLFGAKLTEHTPSIARLIFVRRQRHIKGATNNLLHINPLLRIARKGQRAARIRSAQPTRGDTKAPSRRPPKRISLWKFFQRNTNGAPLVNPDQTGPYSELDETN